MDFCWLAGRLTKLDPPGTTSLNTAWGINNAGVITVFGVNSSGTYLSFTTADKGHNLHAVSRARGRDDWDGHP